ncbi:MAG: acyltransferase [Flavobacterium sp.]|nr:MAG: acyltransferase [Flavobacterium sp.]
MSNQQLTKTKGSKFLFLDGLRGLAALYVMIGHARWLLWEGYQNFTTHPDNYSHFDKALMYFFSFFKWGHEFVLLFFVLSGFVIHYSYSTKLKDNQNAKLNFTQYFYRRAKRIYPPFLLALLLTFLLDWTGRVMNYSIYNGTSPYELMNVHIGNTPHDAKTLVGNVLFLYKDFVPIFGTNGPTWSLKFEWWFYVFYPAFLLISRKHIYYASSLITLLYSVSFFPQYWPYELLQEVFGSMICWWLGVLLAEVCTKRVQLKLLSSSIVAFCCFLILTPFNAKANVYDLQIAFLFTSALGILLCLNEKHYSLKFLDRLKPLGDFSYTLYIIHFPILTFISGAVMQASGNVLPSHSYFIISGILICLAVAYLLHFIVEVPFTKKPTNTTKQRPFFSDGVKVIRSYTTSKQSRMN